MKKILFSNVALVAAFMIFSNLFLLKNSYSQNIPNSLFSKPNTPVVTIGGFINFNGAMRSQDGSYDDSRLTDAIKDGNNINPEFAGTHNRFSRGYSLANDSEIYFKVGAISDSGLKYGAIIELEADTTTDGLNEGFNADKSFIFAESRFGKFEFGNNNAVNQKMKVGPSVFARATGGINGKYLQHINLPNLAHSSQLQDQGNVLCSGGVGIKDDGTQEDNANLNTACTNIKLPRFILIPQSPIAHGGYASGFYSRPTDNEYLVNEAGNITNNAGSFNRNSTADVSRGLTGYKNGSFGQMEDATKINYYTPRINGWQVGLSFTPDTGDNGTTASISGRDSGDIENVLSWGINYSNNVGNLGVALSATGEHGAFENSQIFTGQEQLKRNNLDAYDFGAMFTYFGFTIGGSYGFWGDSLQANSGIYSCNYDPNVNLSMQTCDINDQDLTSFGNSSYYTAGVAYEFGPFATSITHISSQFQENKYKAISLGVDYKMARGFMPYAEITQFEFEANQPVALNVGNQNVLGNDERQLRNNKGYVALIGILLSF